MAQLIKPKEYSEGEFFCKWLRSRMISQNKNVLGVELGPTGSGKSYRDLRKAELWYKFYFKEPFPKDNICFGTLRLMQRLTELNKTGKLRKGEVFIFEEAGANLGSLDFQSKVSKMFTYVLQSFRSMNVAIFFNLPYLSMLNKTARLLMHYSSESHGIDLQEKRNRCRLFFHQVNQKSGKIYSKFPKVRTEKGIRKIRQFEYELPSKYLTDAYESKKFEYLSETTEEYTRKMKELEDKDKPKRKELSTVQLEVYKLHQEGLKQPEIAKKLGKHQSTVCVILQTIKKYGYGMEIPKES